MRAMPTAAVTAARTLSTRRLGYRHRSYTTASPPRPPRTPWFVDPEPTRDTPPHLSAKPTDLPEHLPTSLKHLYTELYRSPLLDPSALTVRTPVAIPPGPPLPETIPKGRRQRGRTYSGEGLPEEESGGIWSWMVLAQASALDWHVGPTWFI